MSNTKKIFSDEDLIKIAWEKEQEDIKSGKKIQGKFYGAITELDGLDPKKLKNPIFDK